MKKNDGAKKGPRKISDKRFNIIEATLRSAYQTFNFFKDLVESLMLIISTRSITVPSEKKGEAPKTVKLTIAEVNGYKLKLKQAKLDLRESKISLSNAEAEYKAACKHNASCVMGQSKKINAKVNAEHKAKREKDVRVQKVIGVVTTIKNNDDPRFQNLVNAVANGNLFRKEMDAILKQEDNDTYTTISGLSSVKSEIYRTVRGEFFGNDDDDNNDDSTVLVTA
jgi:hypothetical protein